MLPDRCSVRQYGLDLRLLACVKCIWPEELESRCVGPFDVVLDAVYVDKFVRIFICFLYISFPCSVLVITATASEVSSTRVAS